MHTHHVYAINLENHIDTLSWLMCGIINIKLHLEYTHHTIHRKKFVKTAPKEVCNEVSCCLNFYWVENKK